MRYRIVEHHGWYTPQGKRLLWWVKLSPFRYDTRAGAMEVIEADNRARTEKPNIEDYHPEGNYD